MDAATKAERRRQGLEDSVDLSQDSTRVAKRAGRINTSARNVFQDASGRRVVGPTSAQIGAGRANPAFYANKQRADNIAAAKAAGTFAQTRLDYNKANEGKSQMDDAGNITQIAKAAPELEAGSGSGSVRVKKPTTETKPSTTTSNQTPSSGTVNLFDTSSLKTPRPPLAGAANTGDQKTPSAAPAKTPFRPKGSMINGKPSQEFFQDTANRQGRSNQFAEPQDSAPASTATPVSTPSAAPATPKQETHEEKVARHAKDVENNHPALFGKIKGKGFSGLNAPLKSASNAVAGSPDRVAKRGPFAPKQPAWMPKDITSTAPRGVPMASAANPTATGPVKPKAPAARQSPALALGKAAQAMVGKAANVFKSLPRPTVEYKKLPNEKRDALVRAEKSSPTLSALNPSQITQGGKSSVADAFPGIGAPANNATATERIANDKAAVKKMTDSGVLRGGYERTPGGDSTRIAEQAEIKFKKDGGRINPFKCGGKMKPMMGGGVVPGKVVPGAVLKNYAAGGEVEENNEVVMVGEEGPELMFKRKDGSMFVTPADVSAQIVDGITMENTDDNEEAMDAAKKRIKKTQVKPKMLGGTTAGGVFGQYKRPNPFDTSNLEAAKKASMLPGGPDPMQVYGAEQWGMAQKQAAMAVSPSQQLAQRQGTALNGAGQPLNPFRKML